MLEITCQMTERHILEDMNVSVSLIELYYYLVIMLLGNHVIAMYKSICFIITVLIALSCHRRKCVVIHPFGFGS
jgi:hypothetical protein